MYQQQQQEQQQQQPLEGLQGVFQLIDPDGDGIITAEKLHRASVEWGLGFTDEEIENMIKQADTTGQGHVKFTELDNLIETSKVAMEAEQKLFDNIDEVFSYFDTGQTGRFKALDLGSALRMANVNPTPQDVRDMLKKLGYPRTITYQQFKRITRQASRKDHLRLVAAIQCFDPKNTGYLSPEKLRQILQPTAGKAFTSFTKQDMEDIIVRFTQNGRINTEVFVHYLMGQEQYLPVERKLPPTPEHTSLLRLRKDSGSDFGIDKQLNKTEIQPKLNAAFKRKLKYYKQMKLKEEIEKQKEAKKNKNRIRRKRLIEIPEENLQSRAEEKAEVNDDDDENDDDKENEIILAKDVKNVSDNNDSSGLVSESKKHGEHEFEKLALTITPSGEERDNETPHSKDEIQPEVDVKKKKPRQNKQNIQHDQIVTDRNHKTEVKPDSETTVQSIADQEASHDDRKGTEKGDQKERNSAKKTKEKRNNKPKQQSENNRKDENLHDGKKQNQIETKLSNRQNGNESSYKQNEHKNRSQTEKGHPDLPRDENSKIYETNKDQIKSTNKEKQKGENQTKYGIHAKKIVGYADRHLNETLKEKEKVQMDKTAKEMQKEETPHKQKDKKVNDNGEINTITEPPSYVKLKETKKKYKEEHYTEIKYKDIPEEVISKNYDNQELQTESKVKSYFELHVVEKQNDKMKQMALEEAIEPDEETIKHKNTDENNSNERHTKGYYDLHRDDAKRRIQETSPTNSPENKPFVLANGNDNHKMDEEKLTYAKLNEVSRKYKSEEQQILPTTNEITEPLSSNNAHVEPHKRKEKRYSELHRVDERLLQIHSKMEKQEGNASPLQKDDVQNYGQSDNQFVEAKDVSKTYAKLSEVRRKHKLEHVPDIDERQQFPDIESAEKYVVEETIEVKSKGYADLHRSDERYGNKVQFLEPMENLRNEQNNSNESVELGNKHNRQTVVDQKTYSKLNEAARKHQHQLNTESITSDAKHAPDGKESVQKIIPEEDEEVKGYTDIHKTNAKLRQQTKQTELDHLQPDKVDNTTALVVDNSKGYLDDAHQEKQTYLKLREQSKKRYENMEKDTIITSHPGKKPDENQAPIIGQQTKPKGYVELNRLDEKWTEHNHHELIGAREQYNKEAVRSEKVEEFKTYAKINEAARKHNEQSVIQPLRNDQIKEFETAKQQIVTIPPKSKGYAELHYVDSRLNNITKDHNQQGSDAKDNTEAKDAFKLHNENDIVGKSTYRQLNENSRKHYEHQQNDKMIVHPTTQIVEKQYQPEVHVVPRVKGYSDRHRDYEKQKEIDIMPKLLPNSHENNQTRNEPEKKLAINEKHTYHKLNETFRKHNSINQGTIAQSEVNKQKQLPTEKLDHTQIPVTKTKGYTDRHRDEKQIQKQKLFTVQEHMQEKSSETAPHKKVLGYSERQINANKNVQKLSKEKPNEQFETKRNISKSNKTQQRVKDKLDESNRGIEPTDGGISKVKETADRNNAYAKRYRSVLQTNSASDSNEKPGIPVQNRGQRFADNERAQDGNEMKDTKVRYVIKQKTLKTTASKRSPSNQNLGRKRLSTGNLAFYKHIFDLPPYPELGIWSASVRYTGQYETEGRALFKVMEYVLPTFEVSVSLDRDVVMKYTKEVTATVTAIYVFGKPVNGKASIMFNITDKMGDSQMLTTAMKMKLADDLASFTINATDMFRDVQPFPVNKYLRIQAAVIESETGNEEVAYNDQTLFAEHPYKFSFARSKYTQ